MSGIEVIEDGITVHGDAERVAAWTRAAGDKPLAEWLAEAADTAALSAGLDRKWPHVVKLKHPVTLGSEQIAELTFRRGRIGDIRGVPLSKNVPMEHVIQIAGRLCGQLPKVIEMLDVDDAGEVMEIALDFFGRCLATGKR